MKKDTAGEYTEVIKSCKALFEKKTRDYGTSWRILRLPSLTDQIFIKAQRIRSIETKGEQKVADNIYEEFVGIINYCIIALIQISMHENETLDLSVEEVLENFDKESTQTKSLLENKNHDYDEAWREMRVSSFTDIILMKLLRIKQIEDQKGKTLVSEGVDANYRDIINYSVFALIKLNYLHK
ncbi:DUF1599 domain-containing protein [Hyphobacterium sp. CCMP332]|nr:DUF1599 domain-containing protein [Hyphobacterium sp. CCMP332]